jgi:hypothetical protein
MPSVKPKAFKAKRVTRNCVQTIKAAPSEVHALICPVKEAEWLDGWDYDLIFSQSGFAEAGCVFISRSEGAKEMTGTMRPNLRVSPRSPGSPV